MRRRGYNNPMKVNLQQALTGRSLRNEIFKTIGNRSLHSLSALLRRSRQRESRYLPYSSQHTILQAESPIRHVERSHPLSPSPPLRFGLGVKVAGRQVGGGGRVQRMKEKQDSSKSRNKCRNKSGGRQTQSKQVKSKEKPSSKERFRGGSSSLGKSRNNFSSQGKSSGSKQRRSSGSHPSRKNKLDLSSIIQHGQERVVTPSSHTRRERSRRSGQKTHKKSRKEELTAPICNRLERFCRQPMKFLKVLRSEWLTVRVRAQRRRIIELEVLTHRELARLSILLDRGNLDCQHVEERYMALSAGSRLALFSCVRIVDIDRPCALPKLHIEAALDDGTLFDRHPTIPYSWLLFASEGKPRPSSRICTKACLDEAEVDPQKHCLGGDRGIGEDRVYSSVNLIQVSKEYSSWLGRQEDGGVYRQWDEVNLDCRDYQPSWLLFCDHADLYNRFNKDVGLIGGFLHEDGDRNQQEGRWYSCLWYCLPYLEAEANNRDRFIVIREHINKNFHFIRSKLQERQRRRGQDASMINAQVREKIQEIYSQLQRMREAVAAEKSVNPQAQRVKYNLIDKLAAQTQELQDLLDTSTDLDRKLISRGKQQTYTEMREQLLDPGKKNNNRIISNQGRSENATEMQLAKMKQWQKVDEQIDRQIQQVLGGIKRWKEGLLMTGELIKETDDKIVSLTQQVDKVNDDLFRSNKQLKGIVEKMRKPHKFCIDVVLVLILVALIVAIVKLSSS